jgi:hypothetical protein
MAVRDAGMPTARFIEMEGYFWHQEESEKAPLAQKYWQDFVAGLTTPLTSDELNPAPLERISYPPDIIVGDNYADALEQYNQFVAEQQWTTGLTLIPPTRELVDQMLAATTRSKDEVLGLVETVDGIATVEKVAINSVMAGAKPEYFPVILAAMDAILDKNFDSLHISASAGSFTMAIIVSGPNVRGTGHEYRSRIWVTAIVPMQPSVMQSG